MSDCCSSDNNSNNDSCCSPTAPRKRACPADGTESTAVKTETLLHHLRSPWAQPLTASQYYFCDNPECEVVYFGDDDSTFSLEQVRPPVGQKQSGAEKVLCYCYGITLGDYKVDPAVKEFVVEQTRAGSCACETRNPSGRCCLKDFPKKP